MLVLAASLLLHQIVFLASPATALEPYEQFFLDGIFKKYGGHGVINFEGFEHLMESLGLGRLRFDKNHTVWVHKTVDGRFEEVHDSMRLHTHDHDQPPPRDRREAPSPSWPPVLGCMTPQEILSAYGLEPHDLLISPMGFGRICPAIVYQLDQKFCTFQPSLTAKSPPVSAHVAWLYGSLSIVVISLCGLLGVSVVPLLEKAFFHNLLGTLVALAVGTLCGDALIHLLPHALESETGDHSITILKSSTTFLTVLFFFFLEACIHGGHSHSHNPDGERNDDSEYSMVSANETGGQDVKEEKKKEGGKNVVGRLVVIGDGLHNLTDGLAVGAAFRGDLAAGFATALAVLTHELPHELGDFAVLLKTGMTVRKAVYYNVLSSLLSYLGMGVGIFIGNLEGASGWVYAATAGSFLYIALAGLVPELHKYRVPGKVWPSALHLAGAFAGGGIMFLIAVYEDELYTLFNEANL